MVCHIFSSHRTACGGPCDGIWQPVKDCLHIGDTVGLNLTGKCIAGLAGYHLSVHLPAHNLIAVCSLGSKCHFRIRRQSVAGIERSSGTVVDRRHRAAGRLVVKDAPCAKGQLVSCLCQLRHDAHRFCIFLRYRISKCIVVRIYCTDAFRDFLAVDKPFGCLIALVRGHGKCDDGIPVNICETAALCRFFCGLSVFFGAEAFDGNLHGSVYAVAQIIETVLGLCHRSDRLEGHGHFYIFRKALLSRRQRQKNIGAVFHPLHAAGHSFCLICNYCPGRCLKSFTIYKNSVYLIAVIRRYRQHNVLCPVFIQIRAGLQFPAGYSIVGIRSRNLDRLVGECRTFFQMNSHPCLIGETGKGVGYGILALGHDGFPAAALPERPVLHLIFFRKTGRKVHRYVGSVRRTVLKLRAIPGGAKYIFHVHGTSVFVNRRKMKLIRLHLGDENLHPEVLLYVGYSVSAGIAGNHLVIAFSIIDSPLADDVCVRKLGCEGQGRASPGRAVF